MSLLVSTFPKLKICDCNFGSVSEQSRSTINLISQQLTPSFLAHILKGMPQLYTLAFPKLDQPNQSWVNRIREQNDPDFQKVRPHFTLMFDCADIPVDAYVQHVENIAKASKAFRFHARRISLGVDYFGTSGYAFLVPDEGHSNLLAHHDHLYAGPLSTYLALNLPYIPHITLGKCRSLSDAIAFCDELNGEIISISGIIDTITVVEEMGDSIKKLDHFSLTTS